MKSGLKKDYRRPWFVFRRVKEGDRTLHLRAWPRKGRLLWRKVMTLKFGELTRAAYCKDPSCRNMDCDRD